MNRHSGIHLNESEIGRYFVYMYPPLVHWAKSETPSYLDALNQKPTSDPLLVYIHVPFCSKRCSFCYYAISTGASRQDADDFLDLVKKELELYSLKSALGTKRPTCIYIGGGTPSNLSVKQIDRLFSLLNQAFDLRYIQELTFECAPLSATPDKLRALKNHGVNRITLGIQQFDNTVLKNNGRIHRQEVAVQALHAIGDTQFAGVNVDFIAGLIDQTDESFEASLKTLLLPEFQHVTSVTVYPLQVLVHAPISQEAKNSSHRLSAFETRMARLQRGIELLEAGGFQRSTAYSLIRGPSENHYLYQKLQYQGANLIGIGPSAISYVNGVHAYNSNPWNGRYRDQLLQGQLPTELAYRLRPEDALTRELVLQLRVGSVDLAHLTKKYLVSPDGLFNGLIQTLEVNGILNRKDEILSTTKQAWSRIDAYLPNFYAEKFRGPSLIF